jgi:hypothetical protein
VSIIGATTYTWNPAIEAKLRLLQPGHVVAGNGIWNDLPAIIAACPKATIILRNMEDDLIDWNVADVLGPMIAIAGRYPNTRFIAHGLNEQYSDVPRAAQWEWAFIVGSHDYDLPTVCLNLAYGNDPHPQFKGIANASDYIGPHLYDGYMEDVVGPETQYVDRKYTSRRYASNWLADYTHKIIATEVGIESFPGTNTRRGWHDMGLSEQAVTERMLENARIWAEDGLRGACWFTAGHTEASWDEGYGMTEAMARAWSRAPEPKTNGGEELAISKQDLEAARLRVREEFLNVQRTLNAAKTNQSFEEQGKKIDSVFGVAGKGANVTDAEFEALAKKL